MSQPPFNSQRYHDMVQNYKESQILFASIRLDVFSHFSAYRTAGEIAGLCGFDKRNLHLLLTALTSLGFMEKRGDAFRNTEETDYFLNKQSRQYLGEAILFRESWTALDHIEERVKTGPKPGHKDETDGNKIYDFVRLAEISAIEINQGRVQGFLNDINTLGDLFTPGKSIDLGGGSGLLSIELAKQHPQLQAIVFERPHVVEVAKAQIAKHDVASRVSTMEGDFNSDDFGEGYDLVIASAVLNFTRDEPFALLKRVHASLNDNGLLYLVNSKFNDDRTQPRAMVVGWLSGQLDGLDTLLTERQIRDALREADFVKVDLPTKADIYAKR